MSFVCFAPAQVLVPPNSSRPLWWTSATEQRMQVAARNLNDSSPTKRSWPGPLFYVVAEVYEVLEHPKVDESA